MSISGNSTKSFTELALEHRGIHKFRFLNRDVYAPNYTIACYINDMANRGEVKIYTPEEIIKSSSEQTQEISE